MENRVERLIGFVFKKWKAESLSADDKHPDEEAMVCFLENTLSEPEAESVKLHVLNCDRCAQILEIQAKLEIEDTPAPLNLIEKAKGLAREGSTAPILEIFLKATEEFLELISTTGDILIGQEFIPAPILRSRKIKDFKDEIIILKDLEGLRIEIKIENKLGQFFNLSVLAKERSTQKIIKDLRVTLLKGDLELESHHADTGKVIFENVLLGKYLIEVSNIECKLAAIIIDIKQ